jgi:hypothetical protein
MGSHEARLLVPAPHRAKPAQPPGRSPRRHHPEISAWVIVLPTSDPENPGLLGRGLNDREEGCALPAATVDQMKALAPLYQVERYVWTVIAGEVQIAPAKGTRR